MKSRYRIYMSEVNGRDNPSQVPRTHPLGTRSPGERLRPALPRTTQRVQTPQNTHGTIQRQNAPQGPQPHRDARGRPQIHGKSHPKSRSHTQDSHTILSRQKTPQAPKTTPTQRTFRPRMDHTQEKTQEHHSTHICPPQRHPEDDTDDRTTALRRGTLPRGIRRSQDTPQTHTGTQETNVPATQTQSVIGPSRSRKH